MSRFLVGAGVQIDLHDPTLLLPARLHVRTDPRVAAGVGAALFDFEGIAAPDRVVLLAAGWELARVRAQLVPLLLARRRPALDDLLADLARATGERELHVFARWLPPLTLAARLRRRGVTLLAHPVEIVEAAALVRASAGVRRETVHIAS